MKKIEFKAKIKETLSMAVDYLGMAKVIFILSCIAFVFSALNVYLDKKIFEELTLAFLMGTAFAIPVTLLTQKLSCLKKYLFQALTAGVGFVLGFFSYRGFGNNIYKELYYFGILCAVILITLYLFIPKEKSRTYFSLVFKYALFTLFMTLILMGGICLLIYAIQNLILNTDDYDVYECCSLFCSIVFGINVFCYYLFYRRQEESSGKAFKVIALYILFPVFAILLFILYIYLIKALVLLKLPNGQINWFVSFASCFYIVFYFILREYDELPVIKFFYKFGAFPFIPLIIIQVYAYFIRVNAYGFTGYRYSSLLFIIFSIITIALTFIKKGKFSHYAILVLTFIVMFDSLTPFNLINMAHKSQFKRMMKVLNKYDLYDSEADTLGIYDPAALETTITDEDRDALYSSYRYLSWTSSMPLPDWAMKTEYEDGKAHTYKMMFDELFGIKTKRDEETLIEFSKSFTRNGRINIELFNEMVPFSISEFSNKWIDGKWDEYGAKLSEIKIETKYGFLDLTEYLFSLDSDLSEDELLWYEVNENYSICFTGISYKYNEDRKLFNRYSLSGYIFYK
ncbi:MAG: DUF4153 domain-containing protein [Treponema sp.]|nr:DUF4153 domain-containing protein [Treponema sp.]